MPIRSYSSTRLGPYERAKELRALYRMKRGDVASQVGRTLDRLRVAEQELVDDRDAPLTNARILVIGPGQHLSEMRYWNRNGNHVVGIDLDPFPARSSVLRHLRRLRRDGAIRVLKTVGRQLTGIDAAHRAELDRRLGSGGAPMTLLSMDAGRTGFRDASFDVVYSRSVFEHLREPEAAMDEIARILRPGGVAHIDLHLYTCDSGCHDARILLGDRDELPHWSHLRPRYAGRVRPNAYLNELRLDAWYDAFLGAWPEASITLRAARDPAALAALPAIRADGELGEYSDEELLTVSVISRWRRPA